MLKHYVEFVSPGLLISNMHSELVISRDSALITLPRNKYGFRFYDKEEVIQNGEALVGKPKNYSGWFYEGEAFTLEQVEREFPSSNILINNMRSNNYSKVVKTRFGQFFPLEKDDIVL